METRLKLTQAELLAVLANMEVDNSSDTVWLAEEALPILTRAINRLESGRKPRVELRNPAIMSLYVAAMIARLDINLVEIANGGKLIGETVLSSAIGLSAATIRNNPKLHEIYERYEQSVCNGKPVTLDNDYNYNYED